MTNDKAIKILKWIAEIYDNKSTAYENQALTMAIGALQNQQNGGWISVEERLPEEVGEYLTLCKTPNEDFTVKLSTLFPYEGNLYWSDYAMERVAYWQPLPEPPKEIAALDKADQDGRLAVLEPSAKEGEKKPPCFYNDMGQDLCLGFGRGQEDDEPIDKCKECWYCEANRTLREEAEAALAEKGEEHGKQN